MKTKITTLLLLTLAIMAGCKRDVFNTADNPNGGKPVTSMKDLVVPDGFNFETTRDLMLDVALTNRQGEPMSGVRVDIFDKEFDGIHQPKQLGTGITDANGNLVTPLSLVTFIDKVVIFPYSMGVPSNVWVPVTGNKVSFHYTNGKIVSRIDASNNSSSGSQASTFERRAGIVDKFSFRLGGFNTAGVPNYLMTPDVLTASFLSRVTAALPESRAVPTFNPNYIGSYLPVIEVTQKSDVFITFVHEGATYRNILLYYIYNKNNPPTSPNDIDSLYVVFPNSSYTGGGGGLAAGDKVKIGTFGKDTVVGFAMAANGYNQSNQVTAGLNIWYSHKNFNAEAASYKDHVVMLKDDSTSRFLICFEDVRRDNGQSDQDFNDVVFYATANPLTGINVPNVPPLNDPNDCDADGISDFYDDYPCDPSKAYDRYFPSKTDFGTLAFEDLWPYTGDYDMNDLVVRWRFHAVVNPQNRVIELNCKSFVDAKGASYKGGFGVEFPFNASIVSQVTGSQITQSRATLAGNGLEAGHTKAVMILFDEAADQLTKPPGSFWNTVNNSGVAMPDTINTKMTFSAPPLLSNLGVYPFNPFLFTTQRNIEVHLPNKNNTALANTSLFGTGQDNTIPTSRYYKTVKNRPWAIHIPVKFDYPSEKTDVVLGHLKFGPWVQSNGVLFGDWYENKPGYRDNTKLFSR